MLSSVEHSVKYSAIADSTGQLPQRRRKQRANEFRSGNGKVNSILDLINLILQPI